MSPILTDVRLTDDAETIRATLFDDCEGGHYEISMSVKYDDKDVLSMSQSDLECLARDYVEAGLHSFDDRPLRHDPFPY